jgi:hypothetical protein
MKAMSQINITERCPIKGMFELMVRRKGVLIEHDLDHNMIVNTARTNMAKLIAGEGTNRAITKIVFGTNSTTPTANDTAITNPVTKAVSGFTYPTPTSVQFSFNLTGAEAGSISIAEFGLQCADGTLFARKTRNGKVIEMDDDLELSGYWTILF